MTWKDYGLVLATMLVIQLLALFAGYAYVTQAYPPMAVYVNRVAQGVVAETQKALQEFERRLPPRDAPAAQGAVRK